MPRVRFAILVASGVAGLCGALTTPAPAQQWLAFRGTLGHEWLGGPLSAALKGDTRSEWTILVLPCRISWIPCGTFPIQPRTGVGLSRVTYHVTSTYESTSHPDSTPWNHVRWHVMAGAELSNSWVGAFVEYRWVWGRLRPQTLVKWKIESPVPEAHKKTPYVQRSVEERDLAVGASLNLARLPLHLPAHLVLLLRAGDIEPRGRPAFDLPLYPEPVASPLTTYDYGSSWGLQIGVLWNP